MSELNTRIAFFGTSEFVSSIQNARFLRLLMAAGIRPVVVVTAPDAPRGREWKPRPLAVKSAALEFGLPLLQPSTLNGFSPELAKREIELSLVVAYGKILPPEVLAVPKFGSLNVHPSLLSRWRGPTPIQAAILAGDSVTGVTIIQMDERMDHGPIIAKRQFPLGERAWTAPLLSDALTDLGVELFLEILEPWVLGKIIPQPQNHEAASYSRILKKEDGGIDWSRPALEIERMVRAFQPWPGVYTFWQHDGKAVRLAIVGARCEARGASRAGTSPGRAGRVGNADHGFGVIAGDGLLVVEQLKPEGGKTMTAADFLRGHPGFIGATLT